MPQPLVNDFFKFSKSIHVFDIKSSIESSNFSTLVQEQKVDFMFPVCLLDIKQDQTLIGEILTNRNVLSPLLFNHFVFYSDCGHLLCESLCQKVFS